MSASPFVQKMLDEYNCEPFEYPLAAEMVAEQYGKNRTRREIKSHHYILSFDPHDKDVGLTTEEAHRMAIDLAKRHFSGHVGIVFTHPEGHNESGNIHSHIVFCSARSHDEPVREWMTQNSEWQAGCKHHPTKAHLDMLKADVMEMCRNRNLHQIDLLNPAKQRITDREYWAQVKLEIKRQATGQSMPTNDSQRNDDQKATRYQTKISPPLAIAPAVITNLAASGIVMK